MDPSSADALCDLADLYLSEQDYERGGFGLRYEWPLLTCTYLYLLTCWVDVTAINYYQKALGVSEGNHRAKEGMDKAQKLLKQSKKRDYYKILGVKR